MMPSTQSWLVSLLRLAAAPAASSELPSVTRWAGKGAWVCLMGKRAECKEDWLGSQGTGIALWSWTSHLIWVSVLPPAKRQE